jgi:hypothetical protein
MVGGYGPLVGGCVGANFFRFPKIVKQNPEKLGMANQGGKGDPSKGHSIPS